MRYSVQSICRQIFFSSLSEWYRINTLDLSLAQRQSLDVFLQQYASPAERRNIGLQRIFSNFFPLEDKEVGSLVYYSHYELFDSESVMHPEYCKLRGLTYGVRLKLFVYQRPSYGVSFVQRAYDLGILPLITQRGSFIVNGVERIILSELYRAPGAYQLHVGASDTALNSTIKLIPKKGSRLEFSLYHKEGRVSARHGGNTFDSIFSFLGAESSFTRNMQLHFLYAMLPGVLCNSTQAQHLNLKKFLYSVSLSSISRVSGKMLVSGVGELSMPRARVSGELLYLRMLNGTVLYDFHIRPFLGGSAVLSAFQFNAVVNTVQRSSFYSFLFKMFRHINNTRMVPLRVDTDLVSSNRLFELGSVGKLSLYRKYRYLYTNSTFLSFVDLSVVLRHLGIASLVYPVLDTSNNLLNRSVRSIADLYTDIFNTIFVKNNNIVKLFLSVDQSSSSLSVIRDLCSNKVQSFFTRSVLSQLMDQQNAVSEVSHLRRLSIIGLDGLTRDNVSVENRDIHPSYFGSICPIETPEGKSVGIVNNYAYGTKLNSLGLIQSSVLTRSGGFSQNTVSYASIWDRQGNGVLSLKQGSMRIYNLDMPVNIAMTCGLMLLQKEMISYAASLVPFVQHDDGNRALMGCNMQRQAVPLLFASAPLIRTGTEYDFSSLGSTLNLSLFNLNVIASSVTRLIGVTSFFKKELVRSISSLFYYHEITSFRRTNQGVVLLQRMNPKYKESVSTADFLSSDSCSSGGLLSLGQNIFVSFLSVNGNSFEDAIVVSNRVVFNNLFLSLHFCSFSSMESVSIEGDRIVVQTITSKVSHKRNRLDSTGVVGIGTRVGVGDVLIGKVTKLLRNRPSVLDYSTYNKSTSTFKSGLDEHLISTIDSSILFLKEKEALVLDVQRFVSRQYDPRTSYASVYSKLLYSSYQFGYLVTSYFIYLYKMFISNVIDEELLVKVPRSDWLTLCVSSRLVDVELFYFLYLYLINWCNRMLYLKGPTLDTKRSFKLLSSRTATLPLFVKVTLSFIHNLKPGDKLTGRHGNKGVISQVFSLSHMPYFEDGRIVDIALNPLGISSRMNIGQIFESHLGMLSLSLGKQLRHLGLTSLDYSVQDIRRFFNTVFNGVAIDGVLNRLTVQELNMLVQSFSSGVPYVSLPFSESVDLLLHKKAPYGSLGSLYKQLGIDGVTGVTFQRRLTRGVMYILKLAHLVDEKLHVRSVGPYNKVTHQPLGGKANYGGQRLGEMEVWSFQSYGAAYTLREMLVHKSDSNTIRDRSLSPYRGVRLLDTISLPESFRVLIRELMSLGLSIQLY